MPNEKFSDEAQATVVATLDAARKLLSEAEADIAGPRNDEGLQKLIQVIRNQNRILRHMARRAGILNERMP